MTLIYDFVAESNMIEGINRRPTHSEVDAHRKIMGEETIQTGDLVNFVEAVQPGARLRSNIGMNVRVGNHVAPAGGDAVVNDLAELLAQMDTLTPHEFHCRYLTLHPFMDGNGRSARALWLYMLSEPDMLQVRHIGFLQMFYYGTLQAHDERN